MIYAIDVQTPGESVRIRSALIAKYPVAKVEVISGCAERTVKLYTIDCTYDSRCRVLRDVHALLDGLEPQSPQMRFAHEAWR